MKTTAERGYGARHQELVKRLRPLAVGTACKRCGEPMLDEKQMHLDHTDDRSEYLGFSHAECNTRAGGFKARGDFPMSPQPRPATKW